MLIKEDPTLYLDYVVGYRAWILNISNLRLHSLNNPCEWAPKEAFISQHECLFVCKKDLMDDFSQCHCGVYSFNNKKEGRTVMES